MVLTEREGNTFKSTILAVCRQLKNEADKLNKLDMECGDGDCGRCFNNVADSKFGIGSHEIGKGLFYSAVEKSQPLKGHDRQVK